MAETGIKLYRHNEEAYVKLNILLNRYRKACVVHPTGTGKSMIAFKYIEDNPEKKVLWLSPSQYIFKAQLEGLRVNTDEGSYECIVGRIFFKTYASLLYLKKDDTITADVIILDEFHRCGAYKWGINALRVIKDNPKSIIIGLSATNVRYYDNRRDMAKELFDDNIASRITLVEALERKMLPAPKYVVSVNPSDYAGLEAIQKQLALIPDDSVKLPALSAVKKIRDSLSSIEGLDVLFMRHMERNGKYIVFCSRRKQIDSIKKNIHKWFRRVDANPYVYTVTCETKKPWIVIREFEENESDHLKLLLCVNILNEGIHITNISGAVLFRPTGSPVMFMQQIGRVLSVNGSKTPVIFDIAANYASLKTIESMYMRHPKEFILSNSKNNRGLKFNIVEGTGNSRRLLGRLQNLLDGEWQKYYVEAKKYYDKNGNIDLDATYVTDEGLSLGQWIKVQKLIKAGLVKGMLSEEQVRLLEFLQIDWNKGICRSQKINFVESNFDRAIEYLVKYKNEHGHFPFSTDCTINGFKLGLWISRVRTMYKRKGGVKPLDREYIKRLEQIGFPWDGKEYIWDCCCDWIRDYRLTHGNINFPKGTSIYGIRKAYTWIEQQRQLNRAGKLSRDKKTRLVLAGVRIGYRRTKKITWFGAYDIAREYYDKHGHLGYKPHYLIGHEFDLGYWVSVQRDNRSKLSENQIQLLDDIGMIWTKGKRKKVREDAE